MALTRPDPYRIGRKLKALLVALLDKSQQILPIAGQRGLNQRGQQTVYICPALLIQHKASSIGTMA